MSSSGSSRSGSGPRPKPDPKSAASPQPALEALLHGAAGDPVRRALWLDAVDQRLRPCLPAALAAHARLANVDRDRLVFLVDAPAWHARLRMHGPQLLDAARSLGLQVTTVVARVARPAPQPQEAGRRQAVPMSDASRRALEAALASLTEGETKPSKRSR